MNRKQRRTAERQAARSAPRPAVQRADALVDNIRFVVASRESRERFLTATATGRSLAIYTDTRLQVRLFAENKRGLPEVYNIAIEEARNDPAILVFIHDDVHLLDYFWVDRFQSSLESFQIIGLAGNKRRVPMQPGWAFIDDKFTWDNLANLSGVVGHGKSFPPTHLTVFGPPGQAVKLLDGLMLAGHSRTFIDNDLRFDERFDFHFYDMDICRQAELKHLTLGTCALPVVHESGGSFGSEGWQRAYQLYLEKWKA